jgi:actin-like ATPase involved in cell morphogenesis
MTTGILDNFTENEGKDMSDENDNKDEEYVLGAGIDIGTMNLVSARKKNGSVQTKRMRDAFYGVSQDDKEMLNMSGTSYIEHDGSVYILGDKALHMAKIFNDEARRPLSQGLISPDESDALEILSLLIENVLGEPSEEGEPCYFSVPAEPLDMENQDTVYHESVFERILSELGYEPHSENEAMGIIFSECADTNFSGIGMSFGSGMVNLALAFNTVSPIQFSLARGGDWIDQQAAKAVGTTASDICTKKEEGIDLLNPQDREEEAIVAYYKSLINYALDNIAKEFNSRDNTPNLPNPIPIVVSGGTSMADGFLDLFKEVFEEQKDEFPIDISEIRQAEDPMTAVAEGLLVRALQHS